MADIATFKKNKIELEEYDCVRDIHNRVLMARFSPQDVEVLEEILYSSLRVPLSLLEKNLNLSSKALLSTLEKLSETKLFQIAGDHVVVDKDMRKYYEQQILKFEEDFKPGMDYLQALFRKVPIHVLPNWYSISRTSDNIFESIVEKYLQTPQIFQRYLMDLNIIDPVEQGIMNELYKSPHYEINATDMIKKFDLSQEAFERHMLHLEFSFVACIKYKKDGDRFTQVITPFFEWQEYLRCVRDTEPTPIIDEEQIQRSKPGDFSVVEEMSTLLELSQKSPITNTAIATIKKKHPEFKDDDFEGYIAKLCQLNLAARDGSKISCTSDCEAWLAMSPADRAMFIYRHPRNTLINHDMPEELCQQKIIREAEKSVSRIANAGWVFLDDFLEGVFIPLKEEHQVKLKRQGRKWKYQLPEYTETEKAFFRTVINQCLFEVGLVATGTKDGRDCFYLTPLGHELFSNE